MHDIVSEKLKTILAKPPEEQVPLLKQLLADYPACIRHPEFLAHITELSKYLLY